MVCGLMTYQPDGSGAYTSTACAFCGSQTFLLEGSSPDCLPCFVAREKALMASEQVDGGLTQLLGVVRELTPESQNVLRRHALAWRVQLEQLIAECGK